MLHDIYYIIEPAFVQQPVTMAADTVLALQVVPTGNEGLLQAFRTASGFIKEAPFCLFLQAGEPVTEQQATDCMAFFFFSNYYRLAGMPAVLLNGENEAVLKSCSDTLLLAGRQQAFGQIQVTVVAGGEMIHQANDLSQLQQVYKKILKEDLAAVTAPLYIKIGSIAEMEAANQVLAAEETAFARQNAILFNVKQQNQALFKQVQQLQRLSEATAREVDNQLSHNRHLRSSSQATALQNYYNNEYEVLPLWYKRLGHIIKVLTGKRSFKSLFKDDTPKYRQ